MSNRRLGIAAAQLAVVVMAVSAAGCGSATPRPPSSPMATTAGAAQTLSRSQPSIAPASPPAETGRASPTAATIARLEAQVTANPRDADAQRELGFALVQRIRETADPSLYGPATAAFEAALAIHADDADALAGVAGIQLGKHRFADALVTARQAIALSPNLVAAHAAEVDALVELGRYDEAEAASRVMFGLGSDITTLPRVSYLAELRGELPAAVSAMRQAAESPGLAPENTAYVDTLLGNLLVYTGDRAAGAKAYAEALTLVPDYPPALAGEGRLAVGEGRLDDATRLFQRAADIVPLPEYVIALGDAQAAAGRPDDSRRSEATALAEVRLFQDAGVVVDVDLALLEADHGDPSDALAHATAAYGAAPTVRAADALAWALHRLGRDREAIVHVRQALRLGSIDPVLRYHAGAIEAAVGDRAAARRDLADALRIDPGFSATGAAEARRLLSTLGG